MGTVIFPAVKRTVVKRPFDWVRSGRTRFFTHYRTGKRMDAWEYGYKCWPFSTSNRRRRRPKK